MEFDFEYDPGAVAFGRGRTDELAAAVAGAGAERALVVAGETTGTTEAVIGPVREGLGDRHADTFAGTTPEKRVREAVAAADRAREVSADALVALGGGSSLDVATVARVLLAREGGGFGDPVAELRETGTLELPDEPLPPVLAVPTTLAGADLSVVAGITTERADGTVYGGVSDPRLMPDHLTYDPDLFETTPLSVLRGSAMNGFDKAVETPYSRLRTPVTDATSERALRLFRRSLPDLDELDALTEAVAAVVLAQYGCSRADGVTLSLLHAFGHALSRGYDLQQGAAHAVVAPAALEYLFEQVDGRRGLLARGLGADAEDDPGAVARAVVREVRAVREALELPTRLRETDVEREDLPALAERTLEDGFMPNAPEGFEPTREGLLGVLESSW